MPLNSGIYKIICSATNKIYVGQSTDLGSRKHQHFEKLRHNRHPNKSLQADFNTYGPAAFRFEVIERCPINQLNEREIYWIDALNVRDKSIGYNKQVGGSYQEKRIKDKPKYTCKVKYKQGKSGASELQNASPPMCSSAIGIMQDDDNLGK